MSQKTPKKIKANIDATFEINEKEKGFYHLLITRKVHIAAKQDYEVRQHVQVYKPAHWAMLKENIKDNPGYIAATSVKLIHNPENEETLEIESEDFKASAESREKQIEVQEKQLKDLEEREKAAKERIAKLEAQLEATRAAGEGDENNNGRIDASERVKLIQESSSIEEIQEHMKASKAKSVKEAGELRIEEIQNSGSQD